MKKDTKYKLKIVLGCALGFYALSMPFRWFFALNSVTEVRPASALPIVFGLIWGKWGALGAALGNLVADIQSGYSSGIVIAGFPMQFFYGFIPYLLWYHFPLKNEKKVSVPRMDSTAHVLKYIGINILNNALMSVEIGILMQVNNVGNLVSLDTFTTFTNNMVFTVVVGIPILIYYSVRHDKHLSLNDRTVLFCVFQGLVAAVIVAVVVYYCNRYRLYSPLVKWNRVFYSSVGTFTIFFGVSLFYLKYMEHQVTIPAEKLSDAAKLYFAGENEEPNHDDFIEKCEPYCSLKSEIGILARSSKRMVTDLREYMTDLEQITAEKERINTELNVATRIQASMLPSMFPAFPERNEFDIYASMTPAKEVGGDFYDFFLVDETHLALVIADVSGKGVPAALFMVITKTLIKNSAQTGASPKEILESVNKQLCENNEEEMFVTVWLGILDIPSGKLTCANAGHEFPVICHKDGEYELVKDKHGLVLAAMEFSKYKEYDLVLEKGDKLFVYTDGVPEATNSENELYGTDRMVTVLNTGTKLSTEELLKVVKKDIDKFVGDAPQFDDITMLNLVYYGEGGCKD